MTKEKKTRNRKNNNQKQQSSKQVNKQSNNQLNQINQLDRETAEAIEAIENTANQVRDSLVNQVLTKKTSSLRAVNGKLANNVDLGNNNLPFGVLSGENILQTKCVACRRRLFD